LASLPSFKTEFILFDTSIADMTDQLDDPVSILFSSQLGGGTDIAQALKYAGSWVRRPQDTLLFCITDLEEGGSQGEMLRQFMRIKEKGVKAHCILGIEDSGKVRYDHEAAKKVRSLDIPCFTATPNELIDLIAKEINQN
jgi:Mg-chelatase subunit ChlD